MLSQIQMLAQGGILPTIDSHVAPEICAQIFSTTHNIFFTLVWGPQKDYTQHMQAWVAHLPAT